MPNRSTYNCPPWCEVAADDHATMLRDQGMVLHQLELETSSHSAGVSLDLVSGEDEATVFVAVPNDNVSVADARELLGILERVVRVAEGKACPSWCAVEPGQHYGEIPDGTPQINDSGAILQPAVSQGR